MDFVLYFFGKFIVDIQCMYHVEQQNFLTKQWLLCDKLVVLQCICDEISYEISESWDCSMETFR